MKNEERTGLIGRIFYRIAQGILGIFFFLAARENAKGLSESDDKQTKSLKDKYE